MKWFFCLAISMAAFDSFAQGALYFGTAKWAERVDIDISFDRIVPSVTMAMHYPNQGRAKRQFLANIMERLGSNDIRHALFGTSVSFDFDAVYDGFNKWKATNPGPFPYHPMTAPFSAWSLVITSEPTALTQDKLNKFMITIYGSKPLFEIQGSEDEIATVPIGPGSLQLEVSASFAQKIKQRLAEFPNSKPSRLTLDLESENGKRVSLPLEGAKMRRFLKMPSLGRRFLNFCESLLSRTNAEEGGMS